jgi:glycosyltransferase involved in cell wall biosynthesis
VLRALIVVPEPPLPEGRAAGRCMLGWLDGLRQRGVDVEIIAARQHFAVPGEPAADLPIQVIDVAPEPAGWGRRLQRLRRPVGELGRGGFAEAVRRAAARADVIHLEELPTAWCDEGISTPAAVHLQFLVRRDRNLFPIWRQDVRYAVEQALAERAAARRHHWLIANSPVIAAQLRRMAPQARVQLVPLCLRPQDYAVAALDGPPVAGLIGTALWAPTAVAMRTLVQRVWPAVVRQAPSAQLRIAGRGTAELLRGASPPAAEVVGEVPSASAFLRELSVLVYPLPRGSGMKVKVLEAIACGVPVVTTTAGAEGIDGGDGVVVADDLERLAFVTARLLNDIDERRARGAAAREAFLRRYTPERTTEPLVELYRSMAGQS